MCTKDLLHDVVLGIPAVVFRFSVHDGKPGLIYVSRRSEEILGLKPDIDGYIERFHDLLLPEYRRGFYSSVNRAIRKIEEWRYEGKLRKPGGEVIWFGVRSEPVKTESSVIFDGIIEDVTEKCQAMLMLKRNEEKFRSISEYAYNWENWVGPDKKTLWTNAAVFRLTGYTREEYMALPDAPLCLIDEADRPKIERARAAALRGETPGDVEFRMQCKDGSLKWETVSYQPMFDDRGENLGYRTSVRDITGKKAAEDRLLKSEARFRSYFELPPQGRAVSSPDKTWIEVNDYMCSMLGYSHEELLRMTWLEMTHPDDIAANLEQFKHLLAGDISSYSMDKRFIRKDGSILWAHVTVGCVRCQDKEIDYIVAVVQDIADRKKMEEELKSHRDHLEKLVEERTEELRREMARRREKEEQYLALISSVKEWIWEVDADNILTFISHRVHDVLGYAPEELLGRSPLDIMHPDEIERILSQLKERMEKKESFTLIERRCIHKDGHTVYVEISGQPFFSADGNLRGYRGSGSDITERKKFLDMLQENDRALLNKSKVLEETNTALRVLLRQIEESRHELENTFVSNIKRLVLPHIEHVKKRHTDEQAMASLDIALINLSQIMSPFLNRIDRFDFTPKEIQVASYIRDGKSTKEIADLMGVAPSAPHTFPPGQHQEKTGDSKPEGQSEDISSITEFLTL